jgi:hypothetical protein
MRGNSKTVDILMRYWPDLNKKDYKGKTPLTHAIEIDNIKIARTLLVKKAKPWFDGNQNYHLIAKSGKMCNLIEKAKYFWMGLVLLPLNKKESEWRKRASAWIN